MSLMALPSDGKDKAGVKCAFEESFGQLAMVTEIPGSGTLQKYYQSPDRSAHVYP